MFKNHKTSTPPTVLPARNERKEDRKMKKSLLKFLPLMAAVLLATSCKKDDDNNAPANGRDGVHTVSTSTIPFSIKVNTGNSLKKVCYKESTEENKKGYYSVSFDENDYKAHLKMVIKTDDKEYGELFLQNDLVTFSGTLKEFPEEGTELTAVVTTSREEGSKTFSDESLEDLFEICAHTFEGKFKFKYGDKDAKVTLTDQNVYLAIAMSPCCAHEITINDETFTVQAGRGRIWIAVPAKDGVKSVGLGKEINEEAKNINPGEIHNVIRQYFTVSKSGERVHFSKGNLQYNPSGSKWQFAEHQYDYCEKTVKPDVSSKYSTTGTDWIDLFGWGMWLDPEKLTDKRYSNSIIPTQTSTAKGTNDYVYYIEEGSTDHVMYKGDLNDLGRSAMGQEWLTLSLNEWCYLCSFQHPWSQSKNFANATRKDKYGEGKVGEVLGIILLPDDWTYPSGITPSSFTPGPSDYATNTYSAEDWVKMEANGAVFLPAAGYRNEDKVWDQESGFYWSSNPNVGDDAWSVVFMAENGIHCEFAKYRYTGHSVRLVRQVK